MPSSRDSLIRSHDGVFAPDRSSQSKFILKTPIPNQNGIDSAQQEMRCRYSPGNRFAKSVRLVSDKRARSCGDTGVNCAPTLWGMRAICTWVNSIATVGSCQRLFFGSPGLA